MDANKRELIYKDEVYRIVGAAMNVSGELGCWLSGSSVSGSAGNGMEKVCQYKIILLA